MAQHESGGLTSQHDIEIFRAWKRAFPNYTWSRADVDRDGLTLFDNTAALTGVSVHFPNAICGYSGTGPQATVTILVEAGFGDADKLSQQIFNNQKVTVTRQR